MAGGGGLHRKQACAFSAVMEVQDDVEDLEDQAAKLNGQMAEVAKDGNVKRKGSNLEFSIKDVMALSRSSTKSIKKKGILEMVEEIHMALMMKWVQAIGTVGDAIEGAIIGRSCEGDSDAVAWDQSSECFGEY